MAHLDSSQQKSVISSSLKYHVTVGGGYPRISHVSQQLCPRMTSCCHVFSRIDGFTVHTNGQNHQLANKWSSQIQLHRFVIGCLLSNHSVNARQFLASASSVLLDYINESSFCQIQLIMKADRHRSVILQDHIPDCLLYQSNLNVRDDMVQSR